MLEDLDISTPPTLGAISISHEMINLEELTEILWQGIGKLNKLLCFPEKEKITD